MSGGQVGGFSWAGPGPAPVRGAAGARCPVCAGPVGRVAGRESFGPRSRTSGFCPRCRTPYSFSPPLRSGDVVGGYRVVDCLAAGGPGPAGWVFLAVDLGEAGERAGDAAAPGTSHTGVTDGTRRAGRQVVLKSLRRARSRPDGRHGACRVPRRLPPDPPLRHPAIVPMLGEVCHGGTDFAVMGFVAGPSLSQLLRSRREAGAVTSAPLPVPAAIAGALRLLSALRYVHERGYLFCDLAPGNVVWNGEEVTLVDLQSLRPAGRHLGAFHVTAGFDAPELAMSPPSVGSDLYALGRLLATAALDFPHRTSTYRYTLPTQEVDQVLARHAPLHRFLLRATAADPGSRFTGAAHMASALGEVAAGAGASWAPARPAGLAEGPEEPSHQPKGPGGGGTCGAHTDGGRTADRTPHNPRRTAGR
ncbi:protein kinase domain-containing protein [Parafrankia irregularis]|uniref:protein kinase domain-containing protein n=1 Tax=Parafrankia irregularis TaxID=795642 RepID=UPI001F62271B|nr:serine/threonine protein kinase [Parafrankia irregularis]